MGRLEGREGLRSEEAVIGRVEELGKGKGGLEEGLERLVGAKLKWAWPRWV